MTKKEILQHNKMLMILKRICKSYMTPKQIKKDSGGSGLEYEEYLEMSYENIQQDAKNCIKGIKDILTS